MKITILSCGPGLPEIVSKYGHSSEWIPDSISNPEITYQVIKVYKESSFSIADSDAIIITGSKYSVYDDENWISELKDLTKSIINKNIPILGICFGHQILAACLGGTVLKNTKGWELGSYNISLTKDGIQNPLFDQIENNEVFYESHQDVVSMLPKGAVELAFTEKANQSFSYNDLFYGVQFHPEFTYDVTRKLMDLRIEKGISVDSNILNKSVKGKIVLNNFINIVKASKK